MCLHTNFETYAKITRLTDQDDTTIVTGYRGDFTVVCLDCGQPFEFIGVPGGYNPCYPTANVGNTELRCPLRPSTIEPPDDRITKSILN
jgi:hypothetical protein